MVAAELGCSERTGLHLDQALERSDGGGDNFMELVLRLPKSGAGESDEEQQRPPLDCSTGI